MKTCPYCAAENRDDAAVCYYCGNKLSQEQTGNTQPLRPRPSAASPTPTQPRRTAQPPVGDSQPTQTYRPADDPYAAQPYVPVNDPNATQVFRPVDDPYATRGYPAGQDPNATQAYPVGYAQQQPGYPPPGYIPPPPASAYPQPAPQRRSRALPAVLIGLLLVVFLCAFGLAAWTVSAAFNKGITLTEQLSTQASGVLAPAAGEEQQPQPTDPVLVFEPSPWPTFTPLPPTAVPQPTATQPPAPTQPAAEPTQPKPAVKLLSPECSAALDSVESLSGQVTDTPTVALDAAWREQLAQAVTNMKTYCGSLDAASPVPGQLGEAQLKLDQATTEFDQATQLFNQGVEEMNPAKLLEAGKHVASASKLLGESIKILRQLGA